MYFWKIVLHALKVIEVMLDLVTCNKYQLLEQIFCVEKLNILPVLLHDIQRVNVKSRRIFF